MNDSTSNSKCERSAVFDTAGWLQADALIRRDCLGVLME